ncbi:unnamed protein product [Amoebophrya sp. A120]|nr:unnamed protein product [Amoebophrya sp. A120]|eukprot:GSA120T00011474001.1
MASEEAAEEIAEEASEESSANVPELDLSHCGVKQRVRDIQADINAEVLSARQEIIRLELKKGTRVNEEVAKEEKQFKEGVTAAVKGTQRVILKDLRRFEDSIQPVKRLQHAENMRILKQTTQIRQDTKALRKMLRNLDKRLQKMENELEF